MESKHIDFNKINDQEQNGQPGFVYTQYDRGAREREQNEDRSSEDSFEETAETESHRPQN